MEPVLEKETREKYENGEALIFFIERDDRDWWDSVFRTREGFRHCFMLQWDEWSKRWLYVDWQQNSIDVMILFDFEAQYFMEHMQAKKGTVVRYFPVGDPNERGPLLAYCTTVIGRYLGFGDRLILTPHRLYRMLIAAGGEIVYRWSDENGKQT